MVNFSLKEKIALVTGASRGIGRAVGMALSEQGAYCVLVGRSIDRLHTVVEKITQAGGRAGAIACDIGQIRHIESMFNELKHRFGGLDILVSNPATNPYVGDILGINEKSWDKTHDVNLKGPFFLMQKAGRLMVESRRGGAIVAVASATGIRPVELQGAYSIANAGLIALVKAFAQELAGENIRVNAVLPGLTETNFSKKLIRNKTIYNNLIKKIPMNHHANPSEIAGAVIYLVSDAASFTTGTCIACDGGYLI